MENQIFFFLGQDIDKVIEKVVTQLKRDEIVGVPTDTIYGVAGLAQSTPSINKIYEIKRRSQQNPLSISVSDVNDISK